MPILELPQKTSLEEIYLYKNFAEENVISRVQLLGLYILIHKHSYQPGKMLHRPQGPPQTYS